MLREAWAYWEKARTVSKETSHNEVIVISLGHVMNGATHIALRKTGNSKYAY